MKQDILITNQIFLSFQDLKKWVEGKHEVEIVDMILKLRQKLKICNESDDTSTTIVTSATTAATSPSASTIRVGTPSTSSSPSSMLKKGTKEQLLRHLEDMKRSLPEDLKIILNNTPTA